MSAYPEKVVDVVITRIVEMCAYCTLPQFNNVECMILLSEISRRRVRNINKIGKSARHSYSAWTLPMDTLTSQFAVCQTSANMLHMNMLHMWKRWFPQHNLKLYTKNYYVIFPTLCVRFTHYSREACLRVCRRYNTFQAGFSLRK